MVLALGGALGRRAPPPVFRQGEEAALRSLVSEDRPLPRADCVLRWEGGPPGARYTVHVVTEALDAVSSARGLDSAQYRVPAEALQRLPAGARLLWRVEAHAAEGLVRASPTFVARLD
jgi:hypothetical protein